MTRGAAPPHPRSPAIAPSQSDENIDCRIISIPDLPETPTNADVTEDQFVCNALQIPLTDANLALLPHPSLPSPASSAHASPRKAHGATAYYGAAPLPVHRVAAPNLNDTIVRLATRRATAVLLAIAATLAVLAATWALFHDLGWRACMSVNILLLTLCILLSNAFPTVLSMLFGLALMLLFDTVTPARAVEGFSNVGVLSVAVLFIVADGIQRTSALLPVFRVLLGKPRRTWVAQLRVMLPVAAISAFLNNTPVVAMLIPVVQSWSRRANIPVSKLLMPLSNAAVLGGTLTLLGTSTNLVVNGLAVKARILGVNENGTGVGLPIFGITPVGLVVLLAGLTYMLLFSHCLLRDRGQTGVGAIMGNPREYTVALLVKPHSPIVGETVQEAGLRNLSGLYLVEITRADSTVIPAVAPDTRILQGDTLLFAGVVETVRELYHIPGLVPATGQSQKMKIERHRRRLIELVIGTTSALVGTTAKESQFRSRFSAAIIAVHRQGTHVKQRIADIRLKAGDTLLVEAGTEFAERFGKDSNFALVSEVSHSQPPREDVAHMLISAGIAVGMVSLAASGAVPLLTAASTAAFLMILSGCMNVNNAGQAVDMAVVVTIASSFGLSNGLEDCGAAERVANAMVEAFERVGTLGLLFGIYIGTAMLSSVITNNAAVTLVFPVVHSIVSKEGVSARSALYTLMIGASACFSTPIGYQTNLMVHGPGGYTFGDWMRFGAPMQLVLGVVGVLTVHWLHNSASS